MQEITLESWCEFEDALAELDQYRERLHSESSQSVPEYLYRGQSNSRWKLETTLERFSKKDVTLVEYYKFAYAAKTKVETFTERAWEIPSPTAFGQWVKAQKHISLINIPGYEYFAYLRHHGYPSPLLDWTASPYIAAFFAFRRIAPSVKYVSVYVYQESTGSTKTGSSNEPYIQTFGPYATIHKRHFLQQSSYTACTKAENNSFTFVSHEKVKTNMNLKQDLIWKFNLPSSERDKVLKKLNNMNINTYSLFLTVDALLEAIAFSEDRFLR